MRLRVIFGAALALVPTCLPALDLPLPGSATLAANDSEPLADVAFPAGPWADSGLETLDAEGAVARQAWQLANSSLTTLQMIAPLRTALEENGYAILYDCDDDACGGFDFRYHLDLLPEPAMHVDLGDFRYLLARQESPETPGIVSVVASRSAASGFVHITHVAAPGEAPPSPPDEASVPADTPDPGTPLTPDPAPLAERLEADGHAVLEGLRFATGSSALEQDLFPSLVTLAEWLKARPERRVILVGHSDAVGASDTNKALSRARAQSVADRLTEAHGVPGGQVSADGVGFLAPRASNATEEGRAANRRVEVVLAEPG